MSSSKAATAKVVRRPKAAVPKAVTAKRAAKPSAKPVVVAVTGSAPAEALRISAESDRALAQGRLDILPPEAMQALFASMCKLYSANVEQGAPYLPVGPRSGVTPTDVMVVASKLLRATNLQVFELGMWQSWTGR